MEPWQVIDWQYPLNAWFTVAIEDFEHIQGSYESRILIWLRVAQICNYVYGDFANGFDEMPKRV